MPNELILTPEEAREVIKQVKLGLQNVAHMEINFDHCNTVEAVSEHHSKLMDGMRQALCLHEYTTRDIRGIYKTTLGRDLESDTDYTSIRQACKERIDNHAAEWRAKAFLDKIKVNFDAAKDTHEIEKYQKKFLEKVSTLEGSYIRSYTSPSKRAILEPHFQAKKEMISSKAAAAKVQIEELENKLVLTPEEAHEVIKQVKLGLQKVTRMRINFDHCKTVEEVNAHGMKLKSDMRQALYLDKYSVIAIRAIYKTTLGRDLEEDTNYTTIRKDVEESINDYDTRWRAKAALDEIKVNFDAETNINELEKHQKKLLEEVNILEASYTQYCSRMPRLVILASLFQAKKDMISSKAAAKLKVLKKSLDVLTKEEAEKIVNDFELSLQEVIVDFSGSNTPEHVALQMDTLLEKIRVIPQTVALAYEALGKNAMGAIIKKDHEIVREANKRSATITINSLIVKLKDVLNDITMDFSRVNNVEAAARHLSKFSRQLDVCQDLLQTLKRQVAESENNDIENIIVDLSEQINQKGLEYTQAIKKGPKQIILEEKIKQLNAIKFDFSTKKDKDAVITHQKQVLEQVHNLRDYFHSALDNELIMQALVPYFLAKEERILNAVDERIEELENGIYDSDTEEVGAALYEPDEEDEDEEEAAAQARQEEGLNREKAEAVVIQVNEAFELDLRQMVNLGIKEFARFNDTSSLVEHAMKLLGKITSFTQRYVAEHDRACNTLDKPGLQTDLRQEVFLLKSKVHVAHENQQTRIIEIGKLKSRTPEVNKKLERIDSVLEDMAGKILLIDPKKDSKAYLALGTLQQALEAVRQTYARDLLKQQDASHDREITTRFGIAWNDAISAATPRLKKHLSFLAYLANIGLEALNLVIDKATFGRYTHQFFPYYELEPVQVARRITVSDKSPSSPGVSITSQPAIIEIPDEKENKHESEARSLRVEQMMSLIRSDLAGFDEKNYLEVLNSLDKDRSADKVNVTRLKDAIWFAVRTFRKKLDKEKNNDKDREIYEEFVENGLQVCRKFKNTLNRCHSFDASLKSVFGFLSINNKGYLAFVNRYFPTFEERVTALPPRSDDRASNEDDSFSPL